MFNGGAAVYPWSVLFMSERFLNPVEFLKVTWCFSLPAMYSNLARYPPCYQGNIRHTIIYQSGLLK